MANRPLAILSEGRLSEAQSRALTLLSLGWLEIGLSPAVIEEIRRGFGLRIIYTGPITEKPIDWRNRQFRAEDEEIMAIISTFIQWQA